MRSLAVALFFAARFALAQDPGTQAAMQAAQQASSQAMQASQQASDQAMQATQLAQAGCLAPKPRFSVQPGTYDTIQTVFLTDKARHAAIYFTTDGWTPTDQSTRYAEPVTVGGSMRLRAVAYVPGCGRSQVAEALYALPRKLPQDQVLVGADGVFRKGTQIPLTFVSPVSSGTAKIGDVLELASASELRIGAKQFAPGTLHATGVVTAVARAGRAGQPGEISFALGALAVGGVKVPLMGVETAEGADAFSKVRHRALVPVVGFVSILTIRGGEAQIAPGALVTGQVRADTPSGAS